MIAPWPEPGPADPEAEGDVNVIMEIVRAVRNARAEYEVAPGHRIPATIVAGEKAALLQSQAEVLCILARLDPGAAHDPGYRRRPGGLADAGRRQRHHLPAAGATGGPGSRTRPPAAKSSPPRTQQVERGEKLLAGPFAQRAPAEVVQRERDKLAELQDRAARLSARLSELISG